MGSASQVMGIRSKFSAEENASSKAKAWGARASCKGPHPKGHPGPFNLSIVRALLHRIVASIVLPAPWRLPEESPAPARARKPAAWWVGHLPCLPADLVDRSPHFHWNPLFHAQRS